HRRRPNPTGRAERRGPLRVAGRRRRDGQYATESRQRQPPFARLNKRHHPVTPCQSAAFGPLYEQRSVSEVAGNALPESRAGGFSCCVRPPPLTRRGCSNWPPGRVFLNRPKLWRCAKCSTIFTPTITNSTIAVWSGRSAAG